jgi:carbonic anhydrase
MTTRAQRSEPAELPPQPLGAEGDVPETAPHGPGEALSLLLAGNRRFAQGKATNPNQTLDRLRELGSRQSPFASILACADSRVPVEILFDQGFGDLFVTRVAGNIATPEIIGSLEYSTEVLGAKLIIVLGHVGCGAVTAAVAQAAVPGHIGSLFPYIRAAVDEARDEGIDAVVVANVKNQVAFLRSASPVIAEHIRAGGLAIVGAVLDFHTGLVGLVEPAPSPA